MTERATEEEKVSVRGRRTEDRRGKGKGRIHRSINSTHATQTKQRTNKNTNSYENKMKTAKIQLNFEIPCVISIDLILENS